jgi:hypothetical protein
MIILRFNRPKTRRNFFAARDCFTPCKQQRSLLEPMKDAAENVTRCATVLLSPARSSFDRFQNVRNRGEKLYSVVKSISRGRFCASPNMNGRMTVESNQNLSNSGKQRFSLRAFLRKKHGANYPINSTSVQKGRQQRQEHE